VNSLKFFDKTITVDYWKIGLLAILLLLLHLLLRSHEQASIVLSSLTVYMMLGLLMVSLIRKPEEADMLEVVAESVFISVGVNVVLMLISTFYYDPAQLYLLLFTSVYISIIVFLLLFGRNRAVRIDLFDLGTSAVVFLVGLSFCLAMYGNVFKYFVEDDVEYIISARLLLSKGYLYLQASNNYENIINYLTGRVFWSSLLSSFLATTGIPPFKLYISNSLFIIAIAHVIASFFTKKKPWRFLAALIVISNPLLLNLSLYLYSALLEAFFMSVFMLYLRRSLEKGKLNFASVTVNTALVFLTQTIKLQMNILLSSFLVLIKLIYDHSKKMIVKRIVILIILLFVVYEGLVDFPYIYYKYVETDASKASLFEKLDFMKLLELPALLFFRTKDNPRIIFDYSSTELLKFIYTAFSPSSYSVPLLVSIWSALLIQLARKNNASIGWIKYASYLATSSFLINFISNLAADNYGGLTKYIVPFLPIFLLVGIYNISIMFEDAMPKWYFIASIFFAFIIFILNFMAQQLVGTYAIYTVESPSNFFLMLISLESLLYMLLLLAIFLISFFKISLKIKISKKSELTIRKHKPAKYISFVIIALIFSNNAFSNYFVFFTSPNITTLKPSPDVHLKELSNYLDSTDSRIIFLNDYMFILPYLSNKVLLSSFTGYLPITSKELSYLTDSSDVNLTIVKDNTWANWIHKMFSDEELKRKFYSSSLYPILPNNEECTTDVQIYKVRGHIQCTEYEYKGKIYPGDTYVITNSSLKRFPLKLEESNINAKQYNVRIVVPQYMNVKLYDSYGKLLASFSPNEFGEVLFNISDYTDKFYLNGTIKIIPNPILSEGLIIENFSNISSPYHAELKFEKWKIYNWNQSYIAIEATVNSSAFINSTFILSSMRFTKVYLVSIPSGMSRIVFLLPSHIYVPIKYPLGSSFPFFTKVLVIADGKVLSYDIVHYDTYLGKLSLICIILFLVGLICAFTIGTPHRFHLFKNTAKELENGEHKVLFIERNYQITHESSCKYDFEFRSMDDAYQF
jgi:hypothetical protein